MRWESRPVWMHAQLPHFWFPIWAKSSTSQGGQFTGQFTPVAFPVCLCGCIDVWVCVLFWGRWLHGWDFAIVRDASFIAFGFSRKPAAEARASRNSFAEKNLPPNFERRLVVESTTSYFMTVRIIRRQTVGIWTECDAFHHIFNLAGWWNQIVSTTTSLIFLRPLIRMGSSTTLRTISPYFPDGTVLFRGCVIVTFWSFWRSEILIVHEWSRKV